MENPIIEAIKTNEEYIKQETLSTEIHYDEMPDDYFKKSFVLDGVVVTIGVKKDLRFKQ